MDDKKRLLLEESTDFNSKNYGDHWRTIDPMYVSPQYIQAVRERWHAKVKDDYGTYEFLQMSTRDMHNCMITQAAYEMYRMERERDSLADENRRLKATLHEML